MPTGPRLQGQFRTDDRARAAYAEGAGIYRIVPAAVAVPADVADLQGLVRWASKTGTPLVARGAGSAMGGGNVGDGVIVDLTALGPARLEVNPANRSAWVSAGITAGALDAAARPHGLRFPPMPSSGRWATLGGMAATNAAGASAVRIGSIRNWITAVEWVGSDGEFHQWTRGDTAELPPRWAELGSRISAAEPVIRSHFPRVRKNSSGYAVDAVLDSGDLLDLLIGSEGTLGFLTGLQCRLAPVPGATAGVRMALRSLDDLTDVVAALRPLRPAALEMLDRTFLDLVAREGGRVPDLVRGADAILLVEFERATEAAARGAVGDAVRAVSAWTSEVETAITPEDAEELWAIRHAASPILARLPDTHRSMQVIEDGAVPISRLADYVRLVRRVTDAHGMGAVIFGHAGDGNVHVNLLVDTTKAGWEGRVTSVLSEVSAGTAALGGTLSGEHGDGRLRAGALESVFGTELLALFRFIKAAFDPAGILNPGIKLVGKGAPIARLKVGAGAADIPEDIALALRDIERTGGYARARLELAT
ncbi:MAG TPA: FAD-binding oxidoreductase [Gemmatimonadales bacterium]|nr:FAD-binding oxidoreductase [Gemmatimonadales bacterium]